MLDNTWYSSDIQDEPGIIVGTGDIAVTIPDTNFFKNVTTISKRANEEISSSVYFFRIKSFTDLNYFAFF